MWSHLRESPDLAPSGRDEGPSEARAITAFLANCFDWPILEAWTIAERASEYRARSGVDERAAKGPAFRPGQIPPSAGRVLGLRFKSAKDVEDWGFILGALLSAPGPGQCAQVSENNAATDNGSP